MVDIERVTDYGALSERLAAEVLSCMLDSGENLICLPSGDTPLGAFKIIASKLSGKSNRLNFKLVGLDEWVGMGRDTKGSCQSCMFEHLYKPCAIGRDKIIEFNAQSADLEMECRKMDRFIAENGPIDLAVLGIGMNGHLGLNEPGTSFSQSSHIVPLSETTKKVAQKYFPEPVELEKGITLGLKHFLEAKRLILIASGKQKAEIVRRIMEEEVSERIPATIAKIHPDSTLLIDHHAASALQEE